VKPHEVRSPEGARKKRTRKGRGEAAGKGKTAGRGTKGTRARNTVHAFFEGGQMPLIRRVPKLKGFTPPRRRVYGGVNLAQVSEIDGSEVGPEQLRSAGFVRKRDALIKILGDGEMSRPVTVSAHAFSASAKAKIESAGGTATIIPIERSAK
jgi:large subunit ribosomal protein L15